MDSTPPFQAPATKSLLDRLDVVSSSASSATHVDPVNPSLVIEGNGDGPASYEPRKDDLDEKDAEHSSPPPTARVGPIILDVEHLQVVDDPREWTRLRKSLILGWVLIHLS